MRLLLDTHVFLWWRTDDPRLGEAEREAIRDGQNDAYLGGGETPGGAVRAYVASALAAGAGVIPPPPCTTFGVG